MSGESEYAIVKEVVLQSVTLNYANCITLTIILYDAAESFEKEVKYFWRGSKSAVAFLYFVNRYEAILSIILEFFVNSTQANETICRLQYFTDILDVINLLCIDYILLLRVEALYSRGKMISICLKSVFVVEALVGVGLAIQGAVVQEPSALEVVPGLIGCFVQAPIAVEAPLSWVVPMLYGTLLMGLAIYKAKAMWKESEGLQGLSLVKVLIRDQAIYFLALILVSFGHIVEDSVKNPTMADYILIVGSNPSLLSMLGAHLLFNMKEAGEKGLNQGTSCGSKATVSGIEFGEAPAGGAESFSEGGPGVSSSEPDREIEEVA